MQHFKATRRVEFHDTDAAGIAHFSSFFLFMEEVEHEFLRSRDLSVMLRDEQGAISWPRVSARCDYQGPVRFSDVVNIELHIARLGEKSVTYGFTFMHGDRLVAEAEMTSVCCRLDPEAPPKAIPIPPTVRLKLDPTNEFAAAKKS